MLDFSLYICSQSIRKKMEGPADTVEKITELIADKEKLAQFR
jgi:hypothetical protein